jgi:hypothetical protein
MTPPGRFRPFCREYHQAEEDAVEASRKAQHSYAAAEDWSLGLSWQARQHHSMLGHLFTKVKEMRCFEAHIPVAKLNRRVERHHKNYGRTR